MGLTLKQQADQTLLDESECEGLCIRHISTQAELNEYEQQNIEQAIQWSISKSFTAEKILSEKFVRTLHQKMFGDVWKWAGIFRTSNKNIGCEWSQISVQLRILLDNTKFWIAENTYPPDEIAIRFKHELVKIHCFPNGNGRHSRIMGDIIISDIFDKEIFTWGYSKLKSPHSIRKEYISALREADEHNIQPLIVFARR